MAIRIHKRGDVRLRWRSGALARVGRRCVLALMLSMTVFASVASRPVGANATLPVVAMVAQDDAAYTTAYPIADRLPLNGVVEMRVYGFDEFARGVAEQCITGTFASCGNQIPVQFDEDGDARFQYLITNDFYPSVASAGGCRAGAGRCTIVVRSVNSDTRSEIQTIFIDAVPAPGRIEVTPSAGLSLDGEMVTVSVGNFPPGAQVSAMLCAAPSAVGERCGAPGAAAAMTVGSDGTGETQLFIEPGTVGADRARCFRGDRCGVSVASDSVFVRAPVVPISFEGPIGARYDSARLTLWLSFAMVLIAIAAWLLRRTDWSTVGEAAAPEIDDAEYADLDAIIAALPPEVEVEELVSSRRLLHRSK